MYLIFSILIIPFMAYYCSFQTLLEAGFISVYNLFYTSQPVLALACFDQDVKPLYATKVHVLKHYSAHYVWFYQHVLSRLF